MREIKFRGKRVDNGEWIYGSLLDGDIIVTVGSVVVDEDYISIDEWCSVDPETVGQYTGLNDKNGTEIYEGDLCQLGTTIYQIVWMDKYAKYGAKIIKTDTVLARGCTFPMQEYVVFSNGQCNFEIIGNIYEHPHLLESAAE